MDKFVKRKDVGDRCEVKIEHTMKPTKSSTKKAKVRHNRQYLDDYFKFGFSWSGDVAQPCPLCVVCGEKWPMNPWYQISYKDISRLNIPAYKIKILIIFKDCYNSNQSNAMFFTKQ